MIHATRNLIGNKWSYYIGNFRVKTITEEEYNKLQEIKSEYCLEKDKRYIVYMYEFPLEILQKYSKEVLESIGGENEENRLKKEKEELKGKLMLIEMDLNAIGELKDIYLLDKSLRP